MNTQEIDLLTKVIKNRELHLQSFYNKMIDKAQSYWTFGFSNKFPFILRHFTSKEAAEILESSSFSSATLSWVMYSNRINNQIEILKRALFCVRNDLPVDNSAFNIVADVLDK